MHLVAIDGTGTSRSITEALAAARRGDLVVLDAANHLIDDFATIDQDIAIIGAGIDATTITASRNTTVLSIRGATVTVADLGVTTAYTPGPGEDLFSLLEIDDGLDVIVDTVVARDGLGNGIGVFQGSTGVIANSLLEGNGATGVSFDGDSMMRLLANQATGNEFSGFAWFGSSSGTALANYGDQNLEAGFSIRDEGSPTLISNDAANNALSGFIAADQSDPVLRANRSIDNDQGGFAWFDVAAGSATGNTARGNGTSGFTSQGSSTATWTANRSSANSFDGFTWFEQAAGLAEGNIGADNSFDGFAAEDQTAPTLRRNSAFGNLRNQFFENGEASPQLFDNDFGS